MKPYIFALFLCSLPRISLQYRAAVAEYDPERKTDDNIKRYVTLIEKAAHNGSADIIAFPEGTLTVQITSFQMVPSPEDQIVPYKNESYKKYKALSAMSEAAARNKIYVVVNLLERFECANGSKDCPDSGYFLYNTNVAFDRKGMVVARYRKFNLFREFTDQPQTAELSTFATDFGVTFGMFICFDILFKTPTIDLVQKKNVTDLIFSTFWFGELPFLTAAQIQAGWSYAMDVNLLASGANNPGIGSTGSGIYMGRKEKIAYMSEKRGEVLIIGGINSARSSGSTNASPRHWDRLDGLKLKQDPSVAESRGKNLDLEGSTFRDEICHNGFCCRFSARYRNASRFDPAAYTYRAVAFRGRRFYREDVERDVTYCALLLCTHGNCAKKPLNGDYPLVFDELEIDADFKGKDTVQIPSTLIWQENTVTHAFLHTMDYDAFAYETSKSPGSGTVNVSIKLKKKGFGNIVTFGIYGRDFTK